jgi:hypothetical protein
LALRPLRNLIHVERLPDLGNEMNAEGDVVTPGGIIVPNDYKAPGRHKAVNKADHFRARVLATGPKVHGVERGDEILLLTWGANPDGTRRSMYTGVDAPDGTLLVEYPDDVVCVLNPAPPQALDASE